MDTIQHSTSTSHLNTTEDEEKPHSSSNSKNDGENHKVGTPTVEELDIVKATQVRTQVVIRAENQLFCQLCQTLN